MSAEHIHHTQQFSQGHRVEGLGDERPLHRTTTGKMLGNIALLDHFSIPNHTYRTASKQELDEIMTEHGQAFVEDAIQGRTIDLGHTTLDSIFFFNPSEDAETPELA